MLVCGPLRVCWCASLCELWSFCGVCTYPVGCYLYPPYAPTFTASAKPFLYFFELRL